MSKLKTKYNEAVKLYESGLSIADVANYYHITRSNMWDILKRRGCKFRSNLKYKSENHFFRGGETQDGRAHDLTEKAILKGILIPKPCEVCGDDSKMADGRRAVQAHHDNYNEPLNVRWLCQKHHHEWHKNNKAIKKK